MRIRWTIGVLAVAAAIGAEARSAVLAQYTFEASSLANSIDTDTLSTASTFTAGSQGARSSTTNTFVQVYNDIASSTESQAIANNDYFTFTLTPLAGNKASLSSLNFNTQVHYNTGVTDYLGGTFFVRSSIDGYSANLASFTTAPTNVGDSAISRSVPLSTGFQDLTSPVTFRIYMYESPSSTITIDGMRVDNVSLNGITSVVPEPATLSLAVGAVGALLLRRRSMTR